MIKPWPLVESKILWSFPIYTLRQDTRLSPKTGRNHNFLVLDSADWVNIVPVTPEGNIVMIRQFRHGTASTVLEIPGGLIDQEGETPGQAASRELLEETGYRAEECLSIGVVHPNPAIQNNCCHTFLARNARRVQSQRLEGTEDIEVIEIPWSDIPARIREGEITHALVLIGFFWYQRYLESAHTPIDNPSQRIR